MKNLKISAVLTVILTLILTSCGNKKQKQAERAELEVAKNEIAEVVSDYVYPLPSSLELMDMLNEIEAAFIIGISNSPEDVEKYTKEDKQALNLGVYLSDLSYAAIYQRKKVAQDYLAACEVLVRELHVDDSFQDDFLNSVSDNLGNRETLVELFTSTTQNIYANFHRKKQTDLAYLMVAGAWTEAMYLTLIVAENTPLNAQVIKTIIFQHQSLLETIELLSKHKEKNTVSPILSTLMEIKNTFDKEDPDALTAGQVTKLTTQVNALRARIVE